MLDSDKLPQCIKFIESNFPNAKVLLNTPRKIYWYIIASYIDSDLYLRHSFSLMKDYLNQYQYMRRILDRFTHIFNSKEEHSNYSAEFKKRFGSNENTFIILDEMLKKVQLPLPDSLLQEEEDLRLMERISVSSLEAIIYLLLEHYSGNRYIQEDPPLPTKNLTIPYDIAYIHSHPGQDFYIDLRTNDEAYRYEDELLNSSIQSLSLKGKLYIVLNNDFDSDLIYTRNLIYSIQEYKDCTIIRYSTNVANQGVAIKYYDGTTSEESHPLIYLVPSKYRYLNEFKIQEAFEVVFGKSLELEAAIKVKNKILELQDKCYRPGVPVLSITRNGICCPAFARGGHGKTVYQMADLVEFFYNEIFHEILHVGEEKHTKYVAFMEIIFFSLTDTERKKISSFFHKMR